MERSVSTRLVAAFRGVARCRREQGAVQWAIHGVDRDGAQPLEVLLSGAEGVVLPAELTAAELHVRDESGNNPSWELRGNGTVYPLPVRAVQVHRDAAAAFARVLPRISAPWTTRLGWWLLLNALRVPGATRLVRRLRDPAGDI